MTNFWHIKNSKASPEATLGQKPKLMTKAAVSDSGWLLSFTRNFCNSSTLRLQVFADIL